MKRVLSLVLALVLVLGMMPTAFAADATGAQNLYDNGFITGKDGATVDAKLDVNAKLTRAQLAALIAELNGAKEEAAAFAQPADFTDADIFQDWAKPFIAYAQQNEWMNGFTDGTFRADAEVPAQQLAAVLLNALGYEFEWANAVEVAADLGIMVEGDALTRGEAFEAMWTAVSEVPMNTEEALTLGVFLGKLEAPVVEPETLEVVGATATNFREVVVAFNKAVDASLLGDKANYAVTGKTIAFAEAAADNMSVTLFLTANITNGAQAEVTVDEKIMGTDTIVLTNNVVDGALPSVVSVVPVGNSSIEVTFSEPVQTVGTSADYKLDGLFFGQSAAPAVNTATGNGKVVTITPATRLTAGEHTLTVSSTITDFAGYGLTATRTFTFAVASDTTPAAATFTSASQTEVVVTFSEPVVKANIEAAAITFTNGVTKNSAVLADDKMTLTVTVNGAIPVSGTTTMTIPKAAVIDTFGNVAAADVTLSFVATPDTERPVVTNVAFATDVQNKLFVTFSKNVALDGTYTLTKTASDGTVTTPALAALAYYVDTTVTPNVTHKEIVVVQLAGAANFDSTATYSLLVKDVTDSPNPLVNKVLDYVASGLKVADLTAPAYSDIVVNGQSMYISFDSAIVAPTAANFVYVRSNDAIVNGLPSTATVTLINDGKTAKITWPTAVVDTTNGLDPASIKQIQYTGLVGADGNAVTAGVQLKSAQAGAVWASATAAPTLGAVAVTGANTITAVVTNPSNFIFNAGQALADFTLYNTVTTTNVYNLVNASFDSTTNKITFTTYETIGTDGKIANETLTLATKATTTLTDLFGQTFGAGVSAVASDAYVPTATLTSASSAAGTVVVTLSEAMEINNAALDNNYDMSTATGDKSDAQFLVVIDGTTKAFTVAAAADQKTLTFTITGGFAASKSVAVYYYQSPTAAINLTDAAAAPNSLANFTLTGTTAN